MKKSLFFLPVFLLSVLAVGHAKVLDKQINSNTGSADLLKIRQDYREQYEPADFDDLERYINSYLRAKAIKEGIRDDKTMITLQVTYKEMLDSVVALKREYKGKVAKYQERLHELALMVPLEVLKKEVVDSGTDRYRIYIRYTFKAKNRTGKDLDNFSGRMCVFDPVKEKEYATFFVFSKPMKAGEEQELTVTESVTRYRDTYPAMTLSGLYFDWEPYYIRYPDRSEEPFPRKPERRMPEFKKI